MKTTAMPRTRASIIMALICFCGAWVQSQVILEPQKCTATKSIGRKVTVSNYFSQNGKLIANVALEGEQKKAGNDSWVVDVEQRTERCDGKSVSTLLVFSLTAPDHHPGKDYELFPGIGYYKIHTEVVLWPRAREICSEEGAHLLIVNSEQESSVVVKLFARHPTIKGSSNNDWAWAGLQERASSNGLPHTIFGEAWNSTGFMRWTSGQPNDKTLNDFIIINRQNGGYGDMPVASAFKLHFICEFEM